MTDITEPNRVRRQLSASYERFTTVLPRRYAAVQEIRTESRDAGTDPDGDAAWARILEVTRG